MMNDTDTLEKAHDEEDGVFNVDLGGASLPPAPPDPRKNQSPRRKLILGTMLALLILGIVLGVSLGVTKSSDGSSLSTSQTQIEQGTSNEHPNLLDSPLPESENPVTPPPNSNPELEISVTPPPGSQTTTLSVQDWLVGQGVATKEDFLQANSYQSKAAGWLDGLVHGTNSTVIPTTDYVSMVANDAYNFTVQYALASLYHATNPDGNNWIKRVGFLSSPRVCEWQSRNFFGSSSGVFCDSDSGLVTSLRLDFNGLTGPLVKELALIWSLHGLDLERNSLSGTFPNELADLPLLSTIFLNNSNLRGPVPDGLGKNGVFRHLTLSNNGNLTGSLPSSLAASAGTMRILGLDDNKLTGDINFLTPFANLTHAFLEDNLFTGTLASDFMADATSLRILDLSDNRLDSAPVPEHLFGLSSLETLDLHGNQFTALPGSFPTSQSLKYVAVHQNHLKGQVSNTIANLEGLSHLDVSQNELTGPLPTTLPTRLTYLFLADNDFTTGGIPQDYSSLSFLSELSLKSTQRTGTIPLSLATDLPRLVLLDLDDNMLTGSIPSFRGNETRSLYALLLNRNNLTGKVPFSLGSLGNLNLFFIDGNSVTGSLDDSLCTLPQFVNQTRGLPVAADCQEVACDCCTICCADEDGAQCHENDLVASSDLTWEKDYRRPYFEFGNESVLGPA